MTPVMVNHKQQGYNRLLDIFKDRPNIKSMLEIYLKQNDDLESAIFQLLDSRHLSDLESVVGEQLDTIGSIVGQERMGQLDEDYRKSILFKIGVNNSQATPKYLTTLLKETTESTEVKYFPHYPASYIAEFNGNEIPNDFLLEFQKATAAGVNAGFIHNKDDNGWVCCEVGSTLPIADKSILPEYTAIDGISASEIYMENVNPPERVPTHVKGSKLRQAFSITSYTGNSSVPLEIDVGLDLESTESMLLWWSGQSIGYVNNYSPLFPIVGSGTGSFRRWYGGNRIQSSTDLTSTGFSEPSNVPVTFINQTGQEYYVNSLKSTSEVLEIFEYTGDGTLSQTVSHNLNKKPLYMAIQRKNLDGVVYWFKGMGTDEVFNDRFDVTVGAVLGGTLPTSTTITVGDIGGSYSPNTEGIEYVVLLLADNPDEGITSGSYTSSGIAGQEVVIGNEVGLLSIRNASRNAFESVMYSKATGVKGKAVDNVTLPNDTLQSININSDTIVLGSANTYTNDIGGDKYYWFNIADPDSTIN